MRVIESVEELESSLQQLLDAHDCALVSVRHLGVESRSHRDADPVFDLATGSASDPEFFHYVVADGIAIFVVSGNPFTFYVFRCEPHTLITHMESNIDTTDTERCKQYLHVELGQRANMGTHIEIANAWMDRY